MQIIDIEVVKKLMRFNSLSIKALSDLTGISQPALNKFLGGADQTHIKTPMVIKLSEALNVPVSLLLHKDYIPGRNKNKSQ